MPETGTVVPAAKRPVPYRGALRMPIPSDPICQRVRDALDPDRPMTPERLAAIHGLRVSEDDPGTHVWALYDFWRTPLGHVSRDAQKNIKTYRLDWTRPIYGAFGMYENPRTLVLVEDCLSAALLACEGVDAVALLGTNLAGGLLLDLRRYLREKKLSGVVLALDPDDAGIAAAGRAAMRLRNCGIDVSVRIPACDIKDMAPWQRRSFAEGL